MKPKAEAGKPENFTKAFEELLPEKRSEFIRRGLTLAHQEIEQLKGTIAALRDELEKTNIGEGERRQKALSGAVEEIRQLKATVQTLRDELEKVRIGEDERKQVAVLALRHEVEDLKSTVQSLRSLLEKKT